MNNELYLDGNQQYRIFRQEGDSVVVSVPLQGQADVSVLRRFNLNSKSWPSIANTEPFTDESSGLAKLFARQRQQAQGNPGAFPGSFTHLSAKLSEFLSSYEVQVVNMSSFRMPDY